MTVDPSCEPRSAAHHLVGAWEALARAVCPDGHVPEDIESVGGWLPARLQAAVGPRAVAELGRALPALQAERSRPAWQPESFALGRGEVEAHTWRLGQLIALARGEATPRPKWHGRAAIAAAAAVVLLAVRPWWTLTLQPWRGTYYARSDHSGKWQIRYDRQIDFDWGRDAPMDDVPADQFSVRWDSCLHLDAPTKAIFQSISDDGSRVYVDGDLIVLNRTRGKTQSRGARPSSRRECITSASTTASSPATPTCRCWRASTRTLRRRRSLRRCCTRRAGRRAKKTRASDFSGCGTDVWLTRGRA
ncbi:PA14 domain-containing protein [Nannocystis pusilla]|uniref:PA14 domain-containing protein n=1 Tax=Nannocystis pusilla TaxID=889268 RepID=UPI003B7F0249